MDDLLSRNQRRLLLGVLAFAVLVRIVTLGMYPLADTTEARYAEIGRKMAETGNWVTPLEDYGIPFWAKPPLSTWLTAASFKLLGVNEFAARFSSLLLAVLFVWLTWLMALRERGRDIALAGTVILASSALTLITAGAVMTDGAVALSTTLSMTAFWLAVTGRGKAWGYLFFVGLGLGLLSKGLVPVVLTLFPIGLWVLWKNQWSAFWKRLPWFSGTLLALAVAVPWYALAEMRTPGFLNYFFIGEHFGKFTNSGWSGDKYGTAHGARRGTIWLYWLAAALPWSFAVLAAFIRRKFRPMPPDADAPEGLWTAYLLAWTLAPMLFFTLAGNIMLTYVMPGLPAFALLAAEILLPAARPKDAAGLSPARSTLVASLAVIVPAAFLVLMLTVGPRYVLERSQLPIVRQYEALRGEDPGRLIYFFNKPHSAKFYTRGKVLEVDVPGAAQYLADDVQDFFVIRNGDLVWVPADIRERLEPVGKDRDQTLYRERRDRKTR